MRIVLQRVTGAAVTINGAETRRIGAGLAALVGFCHGDGEEEAAYLAAKMIGLRIFDDDGGNLNLSLPDVGGQCLIVPNFTLYANSRKGRRPSFTASMAPGQASALFDYFVETVKSGGVAVQCGLFGADMLVDIHNDGPVTIILDSAEIMPKQAPQYYDGS